MQGLRGLLLEGGANNVNLCFLEASGFGSTELVLVLMQVTKILSCTFAMTINLGCFKNLSRQFYNSFIKFRCEDC